MLNNILQKNKILSKICTPKALCLSAFLLLNIYLLHSIYILKTNTQNYFRIHIVANSDSIYDQLLKYKIANEVDSFISELFKDTDATADKEYYKQTVITKIQDILNICNAEIEKADLDYTAYANIREYVL